MKKLKKIPQLQPRRKKTVVLLPNLEKFRSTITVSGKPLSKTVVAARKMERH
jgi:hypothetical protein